MSRQVTKLTNKNDFKCMWNKLGMASNVSTDCFISLEQTIIV